MAISATVTSLEEYLNTDYSPDCEYVDGLVVERHAGERPHSLVQRNILLYLRTAKPHLFIWLAQGLRTVAGRRSGVPDLCVTLQDPKTDVSKRLR
jgi:hypothetical protein